MVLLVSKEGRATLSAASRSHTSPYDPTILPLLQVAFNGKVKKDLLLLYFGPNERRVGKQFLGDPSVDEAALKMSQFSILPWLQRFPHWRLGVRLMPPAPPAPGAPDVICSMTSLCKYQNTL